MAFKLKKRELLGSGIRRIVLEQIDRAIAQLRGETHDDRVVAIHDARKRFKKLRAVLRMVRDEIGEDCYRPANLCFRDAGRRLSTLRDAQVLVETLDRLKQENDGQLDDAFFADWREKLVARQIEAEAHFMEDKATPLEVAHDIAAVREQMAALPIINYGFTLVLRRGLRRIYRRGAKAFALSFEQPDNENLHEWRKRAKDLWYQFQVLEPIWPALMRAYENELRILSDTLGDDHDLALFHLMLLNRPEYPDNAPESERCFALIGRTRAKKQAAAFNLGRRIYAESPKAFMMRLETYWRAWRLHMMSTQGSMMSTQGSVRTDEAGGPETPGSGVAVSEGADS